MKVYWPVEQYTSQKVYDRALYSYFGGISWSVTAIGSKKWEIPYNNKPPFDGTVGWFVSADEFLEFISGNEWKELINILKSFGRILIRIDKSSEGKLVHIGSTLENNMFHIVGIGLQGEGCFVCAEYWGGESKEKRQDFHLGYYKMSRFKVYQPMQLAMLHYDLEGYVVEAGDTNHVIHKMCNEWRTKYKQARYPEYDIQSLSQISRRSVDVFICDNTLEHVPYPLKAIKQIRRILRRGGLGVFMVPFIAMCQPDDFFRFSIYALKLVFKPFKEVRIGSWGNTKAATCYVERNKWVVVNYEKDGLLYCYDRKDDDAGQIVLPSKNDEAHPIHYYIIAVK